MKKILGLISFVILSCLITGCSNESRESIERKDRLIKEYRITKAKELLSNFVYLKEPRTGLCFAYAWSGMANGGPALATVPCEEIPTDLLR